MVCVVKSERVVKASEYVAKLFPSAMYHLVAVVPTLHSRHFLTSLFRDTMESIAQEALHEIEMTLHRFNVLGIKKVILEGRPEDELIKYVSNYSIDLVTITSSVSESPTPEVIGRVAKKVIAESPTPVFVYTPFSPDPPETISKLALLVEEGEIWDEGRLLEIVEALVRGSKGFKALLMCTHYGKLCVDTEEILRREGVSTEYIHLRGHLEIERLKEVLSDVRGYDLLIVGRGSKRLKEIVKGRRRLFRVKSRLSMREHILAGLSPAPVLML